MRKINNFMVDIETTSTEPNAVILTIGACEFDIETGAIGATFYTKLRRSEGEALGLHTSQATLEWWLRQSDVARKEAFDEDNRTMPYAQGMADFANWLIKTRTKPDSSAINLWANDPDFDCVKLQESLKVCGILPPWQYWEHKSQRTMGLLASKLGTNPKTMCPRVGTHHNALDDSIHQARVVSTIWNLIGNSNVALAG